MRTGSPKGWCQPAGGDVTEVTNEGNTLIKNALHAFFGGEKIERGAGVSKKVAALNFLCIEGFSADGLQDQWLSGAAFLPLFSSSPPHKSWLVMESIRNVTYKHCYAMNTTTCVVRNENILLYMVSRITAKSPSKVTGELITACNSTHCHFNDH